MSKILSGIGRMLHVPGFMALLSLPVALIFEETEAIWAFLITAAISLTAGQLLYRFYLNRQDTFNISQIMWVATIGWALVSLLGAVPFYAHAQLLTGAEVEQYKLSPFLSFYNGLFESVSGYTSTGLTLTIAESELPYSLLWWRTFTQWVGGIGIIVFISAFHPGLASVSSHYSKGSEEEGMPTISISWKKIWWIYILLTLVCIAALWVQQVPLWEAINHGMTGICTGGFSIKDQSLTTYRPALKITVILIMLLGSLNFNMYRFLLVKGDWKRLFSNQQHIVFFSLLVVGSLILYYENEIWFNYEAGWLDTIFQMVSGLATCGFQTVDLVSWSSTSLLFLGLIMLIGGPSGSTTGGIKIFRFILFVKGNFVNTVFWMYRREPHFRFVFQGRSYSREEALKLYRSTGTFIFFWVSFYFIMTYLLVHSVPEKYSLGEIAFESASAMGSVGLSTGITGHDMGFYAKTNLLVSMLVGRMELIPLVIFFSSILKEKVSQDQEA